MLIVLVIVPFWTSFLIRTYAWRTILGSDGLAGGLESVLGVGDISILGTTWAILVGLVYNYLPLVIFPVYVSMERLDRTLGEASKDLYAGRWRTFRQITLPLAAPGIVTGIAARVHPDDGRIRGTGDARPGPGLPHRERPVPRLP